MPTHQRTLLRAVDEASDVTRATRRTLQVLTFALRDGQITDREAEAIVREVTVVHQEAEEASRVIQAAEFRQRVALAALNEDVTDHHIREARQLGIELLLVHPSVNEPVAMHQESGDAA